MVKPIFRKTVDWLFGITNGVPAAHNLSDELKKDLKRGLQLFVVEDRDVNTIQETLDEFDYMDILEDSKAKVIEVVAVERENINDMRSWHFVDDEFYILLYPQTTPPHVEDLYNISGRDIKYNIEKDVIPTVRGLLKYNPELYRIVSLYGLKDGNKWE